MLKNAFKKHPLQNRTNVQIKGGGQRPFEQCSKKLHFFETKASLTDNLKSRDASASKKAVFVIQAQKQAKVQTSKTNKF